MRDYYQDGYDAGYGRDVYSGGDYPETDGDWYDYQQGLEDGRRHRRISEELDREYYDELKARDRCGIIGY